jgi:hypothetical protein
MISPRACADASAFVLFDGLSGSFIPNPTLHHAIRLWRRSHVGRLGHARQSLTADRKQGQLDG